jgi:predicted CoA-binding protein
MQVRNETDRYHLAIEIIQTALREEAIDAHTHSRLTAKYEQALTDHHEYIIRVGADPAELENWQWSAAPPVIADVADSRDHSKLLRDARTLAFIGLSDDPSRHSYRVASYFKDKGYRIVPINPKIAETLASLLDVPDSIHIDLVDIFRKPSEVLPHLQEIIDRGNIRTVWLAEGANSHQAEEFAEDYGLSLVTNQCIMEVDTGSGHRHEDD